MIVLYAQIMYSNLSKNIQTHSTGHKYSKDSFPAVLTYVKIINEKSGNKSYFNICVLF